MNPAFNFEPVVPSDNVNDSYAGGAVARSLYVGFGGVIEIIRADGVAVLLLNVPSGTLLPVPHIRVGDLNTDAGAMVAFF